MKKRLFSLFLAVLFVTALLTGCGSSGESADPGNVPADGQPAEEPQPAEIEPTDAVEPLPEKCVQQLARGVLRLDHVPLRDTPLFLLDGTPW